MLLVFGGATVNDMLRNWAMHAKANTGARSVAIGARGGGEGERRRIEGHGLGAHTGGADDRLPVKRAPPADEDAGDAEEEGAQAEEA